MRKNKQKPTTPSSDNATTATTAYPLPNLESTNTVLTATQEKPLAPSLLEVNALTETSDDRIRERLGKLEVDINRLGQVVMQVVNYMEKGTNTQQPIVNVNTPATAGGGGGFNFGAILPEIIKAAGTMLSGPAQPPVDPILQLLQKGIIESYNASVLESIKAINVKNKIADKVLEAMEKGNVKFEISSGGAPAP